MDTADFPMIYQVLLMVLVTAFVAAIGMVLLIIAKAMASSYDSKTAKKILTQPDDIEALGRVEIFRIEGDIYINGRRKIFAVDAGDKTHPTFEQVDWLVGWAMIGLMSKGYNVPHFPAGRKGDTYGPNGTASAPNNSETAPK